MPFLCLFYDGVAKEAAVLWIADIDRVIGKVIIAAEENHLAEEGII